MHGKNTSGSNPTTSVINIEVARMFVWSFYQQHVYTINQTTRYSYSELPYDLELKQGLKGKFINMRRLEFDLKQQKDKT